MAKLPEAIHSISNLIDDHHANKSDEPRLHLGASLLGHPCDRWVWLSFRWAVREQIPGRIRRLFRRGHREEATVVDDLKSIGVDVRKTGSDQTALTFGTHVGGSLDGIIESGIPGATSTRHVLEIKTHNKKSFDQLQRKASVKESKPIHWAQIQLYMLGAKIDRALYVAVCKDDDRIYTERVKLDKNSAQNLLAKGKRIATKERMPPPISTDPSWYQCKFCAAHSFCHKRSLTQEVNCRTCAHVTPEEDGTWSCARWESGNIPGDFQKTGCESHVLHPDLVPWPIKDSTNPHEAVYVIEGTEVRNGEGDAFVFSSKELVIAGELAADENVQLVKETFPEARVVEVEAEAEVQSA
jgi:hypothetical protein